MPRARPSGSQARAVCGNSQQMLVRDSNLPQLCSTCIGSPKKGAKAWSGRVGRQARLAVSERYCVPMPAQQHYRRFTAAALKEQHQFPAVSPRKADCEPRSETAVAWKRVLRDISRTLAHRAHSLSPFARSQPLAGARQWQSAHSARRAHNLNFQSPCEPLYFVFFFCVRPFSSSLQT